MILALLLVLLVYAAVNFYIGRRGWQALADWPRARLVFLVALIGLVLAYPAARILMSSGRNAITGFLLHAGSFHMALMLHLLVWVILIDIFRLANAFLDFFPRWMTAAPQKTRLALFALVLGTSTLALVAGAVNAGRPRVRELSLRIDKPAGPLAGLTVVLASDLHLGMINGCARLGRVVAKINSLEPDIVLLPGDIVDESITAEEEAELSSIMQMIRAPLGVFAVPGNHEFYSGLERNLACLRKCGIRVLEDEAVRVAESFFVVGRRDPSSLAIGEPRVSIDDILKSSGVDGSRPLLLLDHQPLRLGEARQAGIDLQLSGHTHAGQLFPLDLFNRLVWELNWGYLRKGQTQYYVTSGVGTWGPPVRTGSVPEIVRIRLAFGKSEGER